MRAEYFLQSASEFHPLTSQEDRLPPLLRLFRYHTIKSPEHRENRTWILSSRQNYPLPLLPTSRVHIFPSPSSLYRGRKNWIFESCGSILVIEVFGIETVKNWYFITSPGQVMFLQGGQRYPIEFLYVFLQSGIHRSL